ncbi:MAG: aldo/keto reductase [Gemmatimonadaceae bacterium]
MTAHRTARALLPGRATRNGTARYAARYESTFIPGFYRTVADQCRVSSIGLGTYLGDPEGGDDARYEAALRLAFAYGINLVDSAINYRCQRSERAVGAALVAAIEVGDVERDEVMLCTKGGYIPLDGTPPASRDEYQAYLAHNFYDAGIMTPDDVVAGGHCLAPAFIADQIERSRNNLGVETIDIYYLHNPEQQLDSVDRTTLTSRLRDAFALLEERVATGEIGCYGCATWNGLRVGSESRDHLSLAELVRLAEEAGGADHSFCMVQLPINLAMPEALRLPSQTLAGGEQTTVLDAAARLGVAVMASATLLQARLTQGLPQQLAEEFPTLETDAQRAIAFVRSLPAVTAALVGMKSTAHVHENLGAARR